MNKVHFILKDKQSSSDTLIFLHFTYKGEKFKVSSGIKVLPKNWNTKTQRIRESLGVIYKEPNRKLNEMEKNWMDTIWKIETGELNISQIKDYFSALHDDKPFKTTIDFFEYFKDFNLAYSKKHGYDSTKPYVNSLNRLKDFSATGEKVNFNQFNERFYQRYIDYLEGKNYSKNNIGVMISKLKRILNQAVIEGHQNDTGFRSWKVFSEDVYNVYLTTDEIKLLYELKLKGNDDVARDLFIIGCYTGLRVGNYLKLEEINFKVDFLEVITIKNGPKVTIPMHPYVKSILEKHDYELPKISEQKLRKKIKDICCLAKMKEEIEYVRTEGGIRKRTIKMKWQMVSTHTARRSFATNAYLSGIPVISIMKITGHKSIKTFMKYIGITDKENAEMLAKHEFFQK